SGAHQLWRREALFNYRSAFGLNDSLSEVELRLEFARQRLDTIRSQVGIIDVSGFTLAENGTTLNPSDTVNLSWNIGDVMATEPATVVQHLRVSLQQCESGAIAAEDIFFTLAANARSVSLSVSDFPAPESAISGVMDDACRYEAQVLVASIPNILFTDAAQNSGQNEEPNSNPVVASLVQSLAIEIQVTYGEQ
nr:hypothetical protein [Gammaproteobacteria bacterium]